MIEIAYLKEKDLYLNYTSSSIESGFHQSSIVADSFSSIINNNTLLLTETSVL